MKNLKINTNSDVTALFKNYPAPAWKKLQNLRRLILETASELAEVTEIEETLKWGEPSFVTKQGSTIRIDWKDETPEQYALYFNCNSKLISTFRDVYPKEFAYEENRAIVFDLNAEVPEDELKRCIAVALTYHHVKRLPLLGLTE